MSAGGDPDPLALAVLTEELESVAARFRDVRQSRDIGARRAGVDDLFSSIDRYLRLESEVFFPALERLGYDPAAARRRHDELRALLLLTCAASADVQNLTTLERAFEAYRSAEIRHTFPEAAPRLGQEAEGLAYELDEARHRMRGSYGV